MWEGKVEPTVAALGAPDSPLPHFSSIHPKAAQLALTESFVCNSMRSHWLICHGGCVRVSCLCPTRAPLPPPPSPGPRTSSHCLFAAAISHLWYNFFFEKPISIRFFEGIGASGRSAYSQFLSLLRLPYPRSCPAPSPLSLFQIGQ